MLGPNLLKMIHPVTHLIDKLEYFYRSGLKSLDLNLVSRLNRIGGGGSSLKSVIECSGDFIFFGVLTRFTSRP